MATLYNESINKSGFFDYRLLKKKANLLYIHLHHQNAPKLLTKDEENIDSVDLIEYLEQLYKEQQEKLITILVN